MGIRQVVITEAAPKPVGAYAQGVVVGDTLYVAGQIGLEPVTGRLVAGGVVAEAEQALENVLAIVHAAGFSRGHVVKTTVYVTDLGDFPAINEIYGRYFREPYPARATIAAAALPARARVEIDAVAIRD